MLSSSLLALAFAALSATVRAEYTYDFTTANLPDIPKDAYPWPNDMTLYDDAKSYTPRDYSVTAEITAWDKPNRCLGDGPLSITFTGGEKIGRRYVRWEAIWVNNKTKKVVDRSIDLPGGLNPYIPGRKDQDHLIKWWPQPQYQDHVTMWVRAYRNGNNETLSPNYAVIVQGSEWKC